MTNLSIFTFKRHQVRSIGTVDKPDWVIANFISFCIKTNLKQVFKQKTQIMEVYQSNDLDIVIFRHFSLLARKDKP